MVVRLREAHALWRPAPAGIRQSKAAQTRQVAQPSARDQASTAYYVSAVFVLFSAGFSAGFEPSDGAFAPSPSLDDSVFRFCRP